MPSERRLTDVLWHFLCPIARKEPQKSLIRCPNLQLRPIHAQHFNNRPRIRPRSLLRSVNLPAQRCSHWKTDLVTQYALQQDCIRKLDITSAYQELRRIAKKGYYTNIQKCVAILVKERVQKPNLRLYEALLLANTDTRYGSAGEVARILSDIAAEGLAPDSATYHAALRALAIHPDYLLRQHILEELRQRWFPLTKNGWQDVIVGLLRERHLELALDTLDQMHKEDIQVDSWLYDLVIYTLCSAGEFDSAINLMQHRISLGELHISGSLWYYLLDTASRALHHRATLFVYRGRVESSYLNPPSGICTNILSTAARHGDTYLATSVLRVLSRRSGNPIQLHHYEALLETYMTAKDVRTSLILLTIMSAAGHHPTEASTRPIFTHLRQSPTLAPTAVSVLEELREQDRQIPIQAVNVIMEAYIFHRDLGSALSMYRTLYRFGDSLNPNTSTFNLLLRGCSQAARKDLAMFLASEMLALKVAPDRLTYDRLVLVCLSSENSIEDAWRYFDEMCDLGWWPRGGTAIALAMRACSIGDERVWRLVSEEQGRGLSQAKIESLIDNYWKHGSEKATKKNWIWKNVSDKGAT